MDLLQKVPKKTPPWALAVMVVFLSTGVSIVMVYTASRNEVKQYIGRSFADKESKIQVEKNTLTSILELVHNNSEQITQLSGALFRAQEENKNLSNRVTVIEKELAVTQANLRACEAKLGRRT